MDKSRDDYNSIKRLINRLRKKIAFAFNKNNKNIINLALQIGDVRVYRYLVKSKKLQILCGDYFETADITLDYIGKLIHKKDKAKYNFMLEQFIEGKMTSTTVQYMMLDVKSDKYKYVEITYDIFKDNASKPNAIVFAIKDNNDAISCKHRMDYTNRWMEMITQATDITVWNFSTAENKFYYADVGFNMDERPVYISDLINRTHPQDKATIKSLSDLFKKRRNQAFNIEVNIDVTSGNKIWNNIVIYGLPIEIDENGEVDMYSGYMMNVTDKVRIRKEMEDAKINAEKSEQLKEQFIANISHYIRTPLNSIMGFGQIIGQCTSEEERQLCLDTMSQNNDDLLKYINDLLEYSSISAGYFQLRKEPFDINEQLYSVKAILDVRKSDAVETNVECMADRFVIEWDKEEIHKIFIYLIDNAIKVTKTGSISLGYYGTTEGVGIFCKYTGADTTSKDENEIMNCFAKPDFDESLNSLELRLCKLLSEKADGQMSIDTDGQNNTEITLYIPCSIIDFGNN